MSKYIKTNYDGINLVSNDEIKLILSNIAQFTINASYSIYDNINASNLGILYTGFGEATITDPTGVDYSTLPFNALVPRHYVDSIIEVKKVSTWAEYKAAVLSLADIGGIIELANDIDVTDRTVIEHVNITINGSSHYFNISSFPIAVTGAFIAENLNFRGNSYNSSADIDNTVCIEFTAQWCSCTLTTVSFSGCLSPNSKIGSSRENTPVIEHTYSGGGALTLVFDKIRILDRFTQDNGYPERVFPVKAYTIYLNNFNYFGTGILHQNGNQNSATKNLRLISTLNSVVVNDGSVNISSPNISRVRMIPYNDIITSDLGNINSSILTLNNDNAANYYAGVLTRDTIINFVDNSLITGSEKTFVLQNPNYYTLSIQYNNSDTRVLNLNNSIVNSGLISIKVTCIDDDGFSRSDSTGTIPYLTIEQFNDTQSNIFENGITNIGGTVSLGGSLTENTTIIGDIDNGYGFNVQGQTILSATDSYVASQTFFTPVAQIHTSVFNDGLDEGSFREFKGVDGVEWTFEANNGGETLLEFGIFGYRLYNYYESLWIYQSPNANGDLRVDNSKFGLNIVNSGSIPLWSNVASTYDYLKLGKRSINFEINDIESVFTHGFDGVSNIEINNRGIRYDIDYTLDWDNLTNTARIPTKGYVDRLVQDGVTASNGLTEVGSDIQLGGTLTKDTTIIGDLSNGYGFNIDGKTVLTSATSSTFGSYNNVFTHDQYVTNILNQYNDDGDLYTCWLQLSAEDGIIFNRESSIGRDFEFEVNQQNSFSLSAEGVTIDSGEILGMDLYSRDGSRLSLAGAGANNGVYLNSPNNTTINSANRTYINSIDLLFISSNSDPTQRGIHYGNGPFPYNDYSTGWGATTSDAILSTKGYVDREISLVLATGSVTFQSVIIDGTVELPDTIITVNHTLNVSDYIVQVWDDVTGEIINPIVNNRLSNSVDVEFLGVIPQNNIKIMVNGGGSTIVSSSPYLGSYTTDGRPNSAIRNIGEYYFDTTLGYCLWVNDSNLWVNATGANI